MTTFLYYLIFHSALKSREQYFRRWYFHTRVRLSHFVRECYKTHVQILRGRGSLDWCIIGYLDIFMIEINLDCSKKGIHDFARFLNIPDYAIKKVSTYICSHIPIKCQRDTRIPIFFNRRRATLKYYRRKYPLHKSALWDTLKHPCGVV